MLRWRRTEGFRTTLDPDLISLLYEFWNGACWDKRDRFYALLGLANDGNNFQVDYSIDHNVLFQRLVEILMHDGCIDELLLVGATLLQALQLRPPQRSSITIDTQSEEAFASELKTALLPVQYTSRTGVGIPVWSQAMLFTEGESENMRTRIRADCMYISIRDVDDLHVFEYAVEASATTVYVKYAHTYEIRLVDHYILLKIWIIAIKIAVPSR